MNMKRDRFNTYREFLNESAEPSKFLTQEQIDWCDKHIKGEWGVNSKGEVTVSNHLFFKRKGWKIDDMDRSFDRFPVQFAPTKGDFDCFSCPNLTSLEGAPEHVGGNFSCSHCPNLVSLKGAPSHVGGNFDCSNCAGLVSLEGTPAHVGGDFRCENCPKLASLEGAPEHVGGYFYCGNCPELPDSFEEIIYDYNTKRIDWKRAHKLIHSDTARKAHSIGLI
jgi:hypothetical protein